MKLNTWYYQEFSDKVIYFYGTKIQKNGGMAGIQVDSYLGSRAKPKSKKSSVPTTMVSLWRVVANQESLSHLLTD